MCPKFAVIQKAKGFKSFVNNYLNNLRESVQGKGG